MMTCSAVESEFVMINNNAWSHKWFFVFVCLFVFLILFNYDMLGWVESTLWLLIPRIGLRLGEMGV